MGRSYSRSSSRSPTRKKKKHRRRSGERKKGSRSSSVEKERQDSSSGRGKRKYRRRSYSTSSERSRSPKHSDRRRGKSRSRSRERRHRRSRSQSRDRRRGRSRSRSYDRRRDRSTSRDRRRDRSTSRDRRRDRSTSRDRRRDRSTSRDRRRGRSMSHDRKHGYSRDGSGRISRDGSRDRRKDRDKGQRSCSSSGSDDRKSKRHSRVSSVERRDKKSEQRSKDSSGGKDDSSKEKKSLSSMAKEIPDYGTMTPAERVRAKMKMMLDKSTAALSSEKEGGEEEPAYIPTAAQRDMIEAESFETAKFVSHRTAGKEVQARTGSGSSSSKDNLKVRTVDASEYEPQVVELPSLRESGSEDEGGGNGRGQEGSDERDKSGNGTSVYKELSEEERNELWIKKLQKMRERYLASMTEDERELFFKRLDV